MQPTRRSFLLGGRLFGGQWSRFLHRVSRVVQGRLDDLSDGRGTPPVARLTVRRPEDVQHARALCTEMGVQMGLWGTHAVATGPLLWVDPAGLRAFTLLPSGAWRADPGVPVAALQTQGLLPDDLAVDGEMAVACWLATLAGAELDRVVCAPTGLEAAQVLLFDGQSDRLDRFGAGTRREPLGLALRDIVSELFRYAQRPALQPWREHGFWPARYRLDALWQTEPNLAKLLAGSQGTLAWVEALEWSALPAPWPDGADRAAMPPASNATDRATAVWLDEQVKLSFDPQSLLAQLPAAA